MLIEFYCLPFLHTISIPRSAHYLRYSRFYPINSFCSSAGEEETEWQHPWLFACSSTSAVLTVLTAWGVVTTVHCYTQHVASKGDGRVTLSWRHLRQGTEMLSWAHLRGNLFNALPESSTIWFTLFRGDIHSAVLPSYRCIAWIRPWTSHWRSSTQKL